jgi:hypothetical protein
MELFMGPRILAIDSCFNAYEFYGGKNAYLPVTVAARFKA